MGVVCLLIGINFGQESCQSLVPFVFVKLPNQTFFEGSRPQTIVMLITGTTLLVLGGVHEAFTKRSAILPPRLFKVIVRLVI